MKAHYGRNLAHAKDLHAFNTDLQDFKDKFKMITDFVAFAEAKNRMAKDYQAVRRGIRQYDTDVEQLAERALKSSNTALLARALQPAWQAQSDSACLTILQSHDPPPGYEKRSSTAVFWINMHRLAIGAEAFTAGAFVSRAGDYINSTF